MVLRDADSTGLGDAVKAPEEGFDRWDPANVSPFVAYLATSECTITGECFMVSGGKVQFVGSSDFSIESAIALPRPPVLGT